MAGVGALMTAGFSCVRLEDECSRHAAGRPLPHDLRACAARVSFQFG